MAHSLDISRSPSVREVHELEAPAACGRAQRPVLYHQTVRTFATEEGKLAYADEVLAALAVWTASSVPGVVRVAGQGEGFANILGRDRLPKGVAVTLDDERADVQLDLVLAYGTDIRATARAVIAAVHRAAREHLGFAATDVQVNVAGVEPVRGDHP